MDQVFLLKQFSLALLNVLKVFSPLLFIYLAENHRITIDCAALSLTHRFVYLHFIDTLENNKNKRKYFKTYIVCLRVYSIFLVSCFFNYI